MTHLIAGAGLRCAFDGWRRGSPDGPPGEAQGSMTPEVLNLSNRLYVMHRARMVAELSGSDITEEAVLSCFFHEDRAAPLQDQVA